MLTRNNKFWSAIWIAFHLFALVMSHSGVAIFNRSNYSNTSQFWPFTNFIYEPIDVYVGAPRWWRFEGIFANYDWTEFAVYVGLWFLIIYLVHLRKSNSENSWIAIRLDLTSGHVPKFKFLRRNLLTLSYLDDLFTILQWKIRLLVINIDCVFCFFDYVVFLQPQNRLWKKKPNRYSS